MEELEFNLPNIAALDSAVAQLVRGLDTKVPTVFLLDGPLGVGKTQFVSFLARQLGGEVTSSPTFVLHQEYKTDQLRIHHFDFYRLEDESELESTGFWDIVSEATGWICIEWASRLGDLAFPSKWKIVRVKLDWLDGVRKINIGIDQL